MCVHKINKNENYGMCQGCALLSVSGSALGFELACAEDKVGKAAARTASGMIPKIKVNT